MNPTRSHEFIKDYLNFDGCLLLTYVDAQFGAFRTSQVIDGLVHRFTNEVGDYFHPNYTSLDNIEYEDGNWDEWHMLFFIFYFFLSYFTSDSIFMIKFVFFKLLEITSIISLQLDSDSSAVTSLNEDHPERYVAFNTDTIPMDRYARKHHSLIEEVDGPSAPPANEEKKEI